MSSGTKSHAGRILLFDIDGTLMNSGGAGVRAMTAAFRRLFGIADGLEGLDFGGRSDTWIVESVLTRAGVAATAETRARFRDAYSTDLATTLGETQGSLMPGIRPLLDVLRAEDAVLGLGTGNFRRTAQMKLERYGIGGYFLDGGFGDDSAERAAILAAGVRRLRGAARPGAAVVVIGDTAHDVTAGHAIGARVVAVATGAVDRGALEGAGADIVLDDCADLERALVAILA